MKQLLYAVSMADAKAYCAEHDLVFDETLWVLNETFLGGANVAALEVHTTDAWTELNGVHTE